jgi:glycosyltransferase involved in cell wall biosynthesis
MSVSNQVVFPGEVIIADDGSTSETADLIASLQENFPVPIRHIWHEDQGFRLSAIRNKGIMAACSEYIIQIDGDLILNPWFISDHLHLRRPGYFVSGSRVLLSPKSTEKLILNQSLDVKKYGLEHSHFINGLRNKTLREMMSTRYKLKGKHKYYVKGCNMAFWKKDLEAVNGYNEAFTGWGKEDSEIAIRLINAGVKKQFIKMGAVCYHLFHPFASRTLESANVAMMEAAIRQKLVRASKGMDQYSTPDSRKAENSSNT